MATYIVYSYTASGGPQLRRKGEYTADSGEKAVVKAVSEDHEDVDPNPDKLERTGNFVGQGTHYEVVEKSAVERYSPQ